MRKGLIIIPARGGSEGIKNKNIIDVGGKPLIAYTIKPVLKLQKNNSSIDAIVSTDSQKIADISRRLGARVPFLRPKSISGNRSKSINFVLHAIDYFEMKGNFYDYVIVLQPTSPLRQYKDIKGAIDSYTNCKNASLISVYCEQGIDETELYYKSKKGGVPLSNNHNKGIGRQKLKSLFIRNAAIYISSVKYVRKYHRLISENPFLFEMPKSRSIDIDTKEDLKNLREILCK